MWTFWQWKMLTVDAFMKQSAYKVISCDPHDEIIDERASLKSGITQKLIDTKLIAQLMTDN